MDDVDHARELAETGIERSRQLLDLVGALDRRALDAPSELPGWTRLTIACHLRNGAQSLLRMTHDTLSGRETSYYPGGRLSERSATLQPAPGEAPEQVIDDWRGTAQQLDRLWRTLTEEQWRLTVAEPADKTDLGPVPLARLALARLTETDVHGTDLGIGAPDWSPTLVRVGLPTRLRWLSTRRTNHRDFDASIRGSWRLEATEGLRWHVEVDGAGVTSRPARDGDDVTATIEATSRDLLALLLGRPSLAEPVLTGDVDLAQSFPLAFPGP